MINDNDLMSYECLDYFATQVPSHFQFAEPTGLLLGRVEVHANLGEVPSCRKVSTK